jgi:hypothetical protein
MDTGTSFDGVSMHVLLEIKEEVTQTQQHRVCDVFRQKIFVLFQNPNLKMKHRVLGQPKV